MTRSWLRKSPAAFKCSALRHQCSAHCMSDKCCASSAHDGSCQQSETHFPPWLGSKLCIQIMPFKLKQLHCEWLYSCSCHQSVHLCHTQPEMMIRPILTIGGCQSCCDASEPCTLCTYMMTLHLLLISCWSVFRTSLTVLLTNGLAAAAAPVKGGFIREALTTHYPRLAALVEETFRRIVQDTDVKFFSFWSSLCSYLLMQLNLNEDRRWRCIEAAHTALHLSINWD